jgi:phosphotransferase system  glucose/maltose/N-acetylglucosamine-specific IIC component
MTTASSGKSSTLLYGVLYGVASIIYTVILYLGGVESFMDPSVKYIGMAIPIGFAFWVAWQLKKQNGGYLEFAEALKGIFKVMVIGILLSMIFDYVLFNFIDKPFNQALMQESSRQMEKELQGKMSQEKIDEIVDKMSNVNQYSVAMQGLAFAIRCILHFIVALIVAAIMKHKRPVFDNTFNQ